MYHKQKNVMESLSMSQASQKACTDKSRQLELAAPKGIFWRIIPAAERAPSGRRCVTDNHVCGQPYRGFESLSLRHFTIQYCPISFHIQALEYCKHWFCIDQSFHLILFYTILLLSELPTCLIPSEAFIENLMIPLFSMAGWISSIQM